MLDDGNRSERSKRGQFAFEAVQSGEHSVTLLAESLPEGAIIAGEATGVATLGRDRRRSSYSFSWHSNSVLKSGKCFRDPRPVTLPKSRGPGAPGCQSHTDATKGGAAGAKSDAPPAKAAPPAPASGAFALQIAAFDDPTRARQMVADLLDKGLPAYLLEPPADAPNAPYRVRVGAYASRIDAQRASGNVARIVGGKVWVTQSAVGGR